MNGINNINSNMNFKATMDVSRVTKNKRRWNQIAKLFEQKTAKYPNDSFDIGMFPDKTTRFEHYNTKTGQEFLATLYNENIEQLLKMKNSTIVSKFKKMLDIANHKEKLINETIKYLEKMKKITKKELHCENEEAIWDTLVDIASKETEAMKNKDSFLKNIDISF